MSFDDKNGNCFCERCGYNWTTKDKSIAPRSCAKCKSKVWNQPRVYAGKYISGTLAKRFKPTGRAAAQIKALRIFEEFTDSRCHHPFFHPSVYLPV
jgi:hypothetical protein